MPGVNRRTGIARALRRRQTDAERALWRLLRDRRLAGVKFRRQHPVGRYVTDFACPELGLVIELDGGRHAEKTEQDRCRSAELARHGYLVLRFWNNEMLKEPESVLKAILAAAESPSPQPSPGQGRGGRIPSPALGRERARVRLGK